MLTVNRLPQKTRPSRLLFWDRFTSNQGNRLPENPHFRAGVLDRLRSSNWLRMPVGPFVVAFVSGTTRNTPTGRDCLAANTVRLNSNDYSSFDLNQLSTWAPLPDSSD
jgi:hypothetical protein